jgi:hypothetical protein
MHGPCVRACGGALSVECCQLSAPMAVPLRCAAQTNGALTDREFWSDPQLERRLAVELAERGELLIPAAAAAAAAASADGQPIKREPGATAAGTRAWQQGRAGTGVEGDALDLCSSSGSDDDGGGEGGGGGGGGARQPQRVEAEEGWLDDAMIDTLFDRETTEHILRQAPLVREAYLAEVLRSGGSAAGDQ